MFHLQEYCLIRKLYVELYIKTKKGVKMQFHASKQKIPKHFNVRKILFKKA